MKSRNLLAALITLILMNGNLVLSQTQLFKDDFNASSLDVTNKWRRGDNSASAVTIVNGILQATPPTDQAGWVVTQDAFPLDNTTIKVKILQANKDGNIGICPSYPKSTNDLGIYSESSWYRFYVGRNASDPDTAPYRLYAHKKKPGVPAQQLATLQLPTSSGSVDLRLRFDGAQTPNAKIYFEYSTNNGANWTLLHQETFDLPGYSLRNAFHGEIATTNSLPNTGTLQVDDFEVTSNSATPMIGRIILDDPLNSATFVNRKDDSGIDPGFKVKRWNEGSNLDFTATGWKPNPASPAGDSDLVHYDLRRYLEKGVLEVDVTQFQPLAQNSQDPDIQRHHVLAMFRMPWGGHHVVENLETIWDLHTGTQNGFGNGVKLYAHTYAYQDEDQHYVTNATSPWNKALAYHLTIFWEANQMKYLRDGVELVIHPITNAFNNEMQLRYAYVGRDRTVCSGTYITGFMNNQYPTMRDADGPIYSNLVVKELIPSGDVTPPNIIVNVDDEEFANGARVTWATTEPGVVCYVEYGTTSGALDMKTTVLDPPSSSAGEFSTLLTNLTPNTTYYFRVVEIDNAGNIGQSIENVFTTLKGGLYIFKPVADTYIEDNDRLVITNQNPDYPWLYGNTRAYGNYGWMNLMTSERRDCFLQFNVNGAVGNIWKATLRLHGRQTGDTGGILKQFTPVSAQNDWENNATWVDATSSSPQYINRNNYFYSTTTFGEISMITAGQWYSIDVGSATHAGNKNYYFVLQGTGTPQDLGGMEAKLRCGAFDSKESTNFQPELIVETKLFTQVSSFIGVKNGASAWGDYDDDGDLDLLHTGETSTGVPLAKIYRNNNGAFDDIGAALTGVKNSAVAWGDYDMDNDLDILLTGSSTAGRVSKIYRNDNGNFTDISASLVPVDNGAVAWGNYNNERNLDILLSGQSDSGPFTKVFRGTLSGSNRTWVAMDIYTLPPLTNSSVAWGDNNLDDYSDLLLAGTDADNNGVLTIFKNIKNPDGSRGFVAIAMSGLTVVPTTSCAWGNFDTDGDLDLALGGVINPSTGVYKRQLNGSFELIDDASLVDVKDGAVAWADFDNDGDLDLLVTGQTNASNRYCRLYRHDVSLQKFVSVFDFEGVRYSSVAWGDYDNDSDLDVLFSGENGSSIPITRLYRNNSITPNTPPTVPTNLSDAYSETDDTVTLTWDESTDSPKPQNVITYNVMIGTSEGGFDIVSPMSIPDSGKRMIPEPGNASTNKTYIVSTRNGIGLAPGTYWWKVQAIDNLFAASAFSDANSFTVPVPKTAAGDSVADLANTRQAIPKEFSLSPNYPNPFNPSTRLNLNLPENGRVVAVVYDLKGQEVVRLHDAEMVAGYKFLDWDGRNAAGTVASNGVYFVKVIFAGESGARKESTSRVLLLK